MKRALDIVSSFTPLILSAYTIAFMGPKASYWMMRLDTAIGVVWDFPFKNGLPALCLAYCLAASSFKKSRTPVTLSGVLINAVILAAILKVRAELSKGFMVW